ncbi:MAG TPA: ABC transporter ATP-binding protein/permease [Burkholderiales bacterium]|nr:ABC transporter ATP-binding protein/permease [Burkholderiales bacterium]
MERSLFKFILRYSKREQLMILPLIVASMLIYFASLDLPKAIINEAIQGRRFAGPESTVPFLKIQFALPHLLGGGTVRIFDGFPMHQLPYLVALTMAFLLLIVVSGVLKFQINTMKGWMGERMLRRLRYLLFDQMLRFPLARFRRVKSAEVATMIKDEVEPLGGFIGESIITPLFLGGQALTAMIFILSQHIYLGLIAFGVVALQGYVIPRMRRRLLVLGRERQITARQLAGRIAECVDGVTEIHAHDTSNYERAEISYRLGKIFRIRFELYQQKFITKFLNNFLSQFTPFLFYLVGGYLVIKNRLDIGTLVAVIGAYKDLPSPVKELIDWDQQRLDVQIKYTQVVEQFTVEDITPPELQALMPEPALPQSGRIRASNLTLAGEAGAKLIDGVSFDVGMDQHLAILGSHAAGAGELTQLLARLVMPSAGSLEVGGVDIVRAPEAVTGRALAYVGPTAYLFPVSVRENLLYGLKHYPVRERAYDGDERDEREFQVQEAERTGSTPLDFRADWIDYRGAGVRGPEELDHRLLEVLKTVELEETIFELGLRSAVDPEQFPGLEESVLRARAAMRTRLAAPDVQGLVEHFDAERYNRNATLAENLLFGTPVGKAFDIENLGRNAYVRRVLAETGLAGDLLRTGQKIAETMVELFSGLPPGHEFFERFSFIRQEDLPEVKAVLGRVADAGLDAIGEADRDLLLGLPFKMIGARHRLGLIDEAFEARILQARRYFAANLPADLRGAVEFFDAERFNRAATLQDNILFGKVATGQARAGVRIGTMLREVLEELRLRSEVVALGLGYNVGVAGARLSSADRQKVAIARALIKRPAVLVLDQAAAGLDAGSQNRLVASILGYCRGRSVIWALQRNDLAERFDHTLVLERGRIAEQGRFQDLKSRGGALQKLLHAA